MSYSAPPPPGQGGPPGYGDQYGGGYAQAGTNQKAVWALVTGILGLLCCGLIGIAGIVLGNTAKGEIDASGGAQTGRGMAQAGVVLGIISLVWTVIAVLLLVSGVMTFPSGSTSP